jgi:hypothetical protein
MDFPSSRGYPIPIILETGSFGAFLSGKPLILLQLMTFLSNVIIYFLIFSGMYFGYSKLFKKAKKK